MKPWEYIGQWLRDLDSDRSVYDTVSEQMDVPCYVIVPGDPWIEEDGPHATFGNHPENYEVWALASASEGWSSQDEIHSMVHRIRHNLPEGVAFVSVGGITQIDQQGATYLGAPVRVRYHNCDSEVFESS